MKERCGSRAFIKWAAEEETRDGITRTREEWCAIKGVPPAAVYRRMVSYKWDFARALDTPLKEMRTGSFGDRASPAAVAATRRANKFFDSEYPELRKRRR